LTTELDRIKILEGKIVQVVDYVRKLTAENDKLKQQLKELKGEKKDFEEQNRRLAKLDEDLKKYESERDIVKGKIEAIISQIDQLGL
jgi:FtsZ-binding cell division protein ZapB